MSTETSKQLVNANIEVLLEKLAKQKHVSKSNGKKRKPFERIVLKGEGPTTTEIIIEGRR